MAGLIRRVALAAITTGVLLTAVAPPTAAAPVRPAGTIEYGANSTKFAALHAADPLADTERVYEHGRNVLPRTWPAGAPHVVLSFEPDPATLLSGGLDARLLALAATVPGGTTGDITPCYEAGPANPRHYSGGCAHASTVVAMETYLHRLLDVRHHTRLRVGSLVCGPVPQLTGWIAGRLDWYGADIAGGWFFKNGQFETRRLAVRLANDAAIWHAKSPHAPVVIGETNTQHDRNRAAWLELLSADLSRVSVHSTILTFWRTARVRQGTQAGFWPPSHHTIIALRWLAEHYDPYPPPWTSGGPR